MGLLDRNIWMSHTGERPLCALRQPRASQSKIANAGAGGSRPRRVRYAPASVGARLPDFLIIGAQKAGTTSLWGYLRSHPQVFVPDLKEPTFFVDEGTWGRGLDWYRGLFRGAGPDQVVGEASPGYTMFPWFASAPERIAATVPDVKLVYLIRDPIARMASSWLHSRVDFLENRAMAEALIADTRYVALSQYAMQIEQYLEHFDRSSLLILRAEDLDADRKATVAKVCDFIGVDPSRLGSTEERLNTSESKMIPLRRTEVLHRYLIRARRPALAARLASPGLSRWTQRAARAEDVTIDDDLRSRLLGYLKVDLLRLRELVGPDFDLWGYA